MKSTQSCNVNNSALTSVTCLCDQKQAIKQNIINDWCLDFFWGILLLLFFIYNLSHLVNLFPEWHSKKWNEGCLKHNLIIFGHLLQHNGHRPYMLSLLHLTEWDMWHNKIIRLLKQAVMQLRHPEPLIIHVVWLHLSHCVNVYQVGWRICWGEGETS